MAQEYRIVSRFNEDVEYAFDDMLLDEEDEMTESDIHHIEIFCKPYSIAMGKLKNSEEDDSLGFFICYLLYGKKVIRKLGIYETNHSANKMASINHRSFDFEKEKLILFDEYYEDTEKLQPYMYKKEENAPTKSIVQLKQGNIYFEENTEQQPLFLQKLQERVEKYKPEKTTKILDKYHKYLTFIYTMLVNPKDKSVVKNKLKSPKDSNFKIIKTDGSISFDTEESFLFENLVKPDIQLDVFDLALFELMANVKIFVIENGDFDFNFLKYKEAANYKKINTISLYKKFNPKDVMFIHRTTNNDEDTDINILLYNDKLFNSFDDLNIELLKFILKKCNENLQEEHHPTRFEYFKSLTEKMKNVEDAEDKDETEMEEEESKMEHEQEDKKGENLGEELPKINITQKPPPKLKQPE